MTLLLVQLDTVADHALPLARWVDRLLWSWSPWHLRHQAVQDARHIRDRDCHIRELRVDLRDSEARRRQLVSYIENPLPSLARFIEPPDTASSVDAEFRSHTVHLRQRVLSFQLIGEAFGRAARCQDLVEELRYAVRSALARMADDLTSQLTEQLNAQNIR